MYSTARIGAAECKNDVATTLLYSFDVVMTSKWRHFNVVFLIVMSVMEKLFCFQIHMEKLLQNNIFVLKLIKY